MLTFHGSYSQLLIHRATPPQDLGSLNCVLSLPDSSLLFSPSGLASFCTSLGRPTPTSTPFIGNNPEASTRNRNLNTYSAECYPALCSKGCFFQNALHTAVKIAQCTLYKHQLPFLQISGTTVKRYGVSPQEAGRHLELRHLIA